MSCVGGGGGGGAFIRRLCGACDDGGFASGGATCGAPLRPGGAWWRSAGRAGMRRRARLRPGWRSYAVNPYPCT